MDREGAKPATELELKYKTALDTIAAGRPWETIIANAALERTSRARVRRVFAFLGDNLAAIASLVVALSGISFGILQYQTGESQKEKESQIAKVEALQKLIPPLTSENPNVRRYALAALLTLYASSTKSSASDNSDLRSLAENIKAVGDAETLEALGRKLNDPQLKKKASELYAMQAEVSRHNSSNAENAKEFDKAKQFLKAAWEDTQRALSLDSENAKAVYQLGRLLMDDRGDYSAAGEKFNQVIQLIDAGKYPRDNEIYLRSYLNQTLCLYLPDKKTTEGVCESYKVTNAKYRNAGWDLDVPGEKLEDIENNCR